MQIIFYYKINGSLNNDLGLNNENNKMDSIISDSKTANNDSDIETEKHNVILFGINTSIHLSYHAVLNFCREIENSLIKEFPGYEIEIKRSPLYSY